MRNLDFLRTGNYNRSNGNINERVANGNWWSLSSGSPTNGHNLNTNPTNVKPQNNNYRGNGFAIRCVFSGTSYTPQPKFGFKHKK